MRNLRLLFLVGLATGFISEKLFVSSQTSSPTADDLYLEGRTSGDLPIDDEDGDDDGSGSGSGDFSSSSFTDTEEIFKFLNVSQTTISKEVVPTEAEPTAESPRSTLTTAADNQHPSTKVKDTETTPFMSPDGDNSNNEVASSTADWFTQNTSPSSTSVPPTETTAAQDITVIDHTDGDNSLDTWDVSTSENQGDKVVIKDVENDLQIENRQGHINNVAPEEVTSENMWERTEVLAAVIACGVIGFLCAVFLLLLLAYRMKKKDEGSYDLGDNKVSTTAYHKAPTKEFYA